MHISNIHIKCSVRVLFYWHGILQKNIHTKKIYFKPRKKYHNTMHYSHMFNFSHHAFLYYYFRYFTKKNIICIYTDTTPFMRSMHCYSTQILLLNKIMCCYTKYEHDVSFYQKFWTHIFGWMVCILYVMCIKYHFFCSCYPFTYHLLPSFTQHKAWFYMVFYYCISLVTWLRLN